MKKILTYFVIFFISSCYYLNSQINSKLIIDFVPIDYNYYNYSYKTAYSSGKINNKVINNFATLGYPSMEQSLSASASFYNFLNYGATYLPIKITNNEMTNTLLETFLYSGIFLIAEFVPLGDAWLHEEFHRSILTKNYVNSYNQVNNFPLFSELISVNRVNDSALIFFKLSNPVDFVRAHSAGIEGEYMLIKKFENYNFFHEQKLPYFVYNLAWTINSFYYVFICHLNEAEVITNEENLKDGTNLKRRDFTGLDFTAWVYDLYKPFESYKNRGVHPSGVGVDRYIKPSDLTNEELKYLKKQGFLQMINFISPFIIGINKIPIKKIGEYSYFNFAFRHLLTSFGYDLSLDLYYKNNNNYVTTFHFYKNKNILLPGFDMMIQDYNFRVPNANFLVTSGVSFWFQPENLLFHDNTSKLGGMYSLKIGPYFKYLYPYISISFKTKGWVASNVFQEKNYSIWFGLKFFLKQE